MNRLTLIGIGFAGVLVGGYGVLNGLGFPVDNVQAGLVIGALVGGTAVAPAAYSAGKNAKDTDPPA